MLYRASKENIRSKKDGLLCYKQFNLAIKLEQVERQKNNNQDINQQYFIDLLMRARDGMTNWSFLDADWKFLLNNKNTPAKQEEFANATRLFMDNHSCNNYNASKLIRNCK